MTKVSMGNQPLVFPTPAWVITTYDDKGQPNMATAAWGGVCCSKPPCVGISFRAATYTHGNIHSRKAFCICVPSEKYVAETDYAGIATGREVNKFEMTGLTPCKSDIVDAPYIGEFPLIIECKLFKTTELGLHTQFIGEIMDVKTEESLVGESGLPELHDVAPLIFAPRTRRYYGVGKKLEDGFSIGKKLSK